jgi:hypothetical protein
VPSIGLYITFGIAVEYPPVAVHAIKYDVESQHPTALYTLLGASVVVVVLVVLVVVVVVGARVVVVVVVLPTY